MSNQEIVMLFRVILKKLRIGLLKLKDQNAEKEGDGDIEHKNEVNEKLKEKLNK